MKKDLKSRKKSTRATGQSNGNGSKDQAFEGLTFQQEMLLKSLQGKSQQELQDAFYRMAKQQIGQGTFNETAILQIIDRFSSMIAPEQKDKMLQMLSLLRDNG